MSEDGLDKIKEYFQQKVTEQSTAVAPFFKERFDDRDIVTNAEMLTLLEDLDVGYGQDVLWDITIASNAIKQVFPDAQPTLLGDEKDWTRTRAWRLNQDDKDTTRTDQRGSSRRSRRRI